MYIGSPEELVRRLLASKPVDDAQTKEDAFTIDKEVLSYN
jgi:hypothetical protein